MSAPVHRLIERALIAGILLGIFGMFQPWLLDLFQYGFLLLLISTVGFTVISHISPRPDDTPTAEDATRSI